MYLPVELTAAGSRFVAVRFCTASCALRWIQARHGAQQPPPQQQQQQQQPPAMASEEFLPPPLALARQQVMYGPSQLNPSLPLHPQGIFMQQHRCQQQQQQQQQIFQPNQLQLQPVQPIDWNSLFHQNPQFAQQMQLQLFIMQQQQQQHNVFDEDGNERGAHIHGTGDEARSAVEDDEERDLSVGSEPEEEKGGADEVPQQHQHSGGRALGSNKHVRCYAMQHEQADALSAGGAGKRFKHGAYAPAEPSDEATNQLVHMDTSQNVDPSWQESHWSTSQNSPQLLQQY